MPKGSIGGLFAPAKRLPPMSPMFPLGIFVYNLMSFQAMAWANAQQFPNAECKLLLLMLANRSNDHDPGVYTCWPSIETLTKDCLLSKTTIKIRIKQLVESGLLKVEHRKTKEGLNQSNLFVLPFSLENKPKINGLPDAPRESPETGGSVAARPSSGSPHDPRNSNIETVIETVHTHTQPTAKKSMAESKSIGPSWKEVEQWVKEVKDKGFPYVIQEVRNVWLSFNLSKWKWGENDVVHDWKHAMELRLAEKYSLK